MNSERRRKRSNFAGLALQYWLSAIAQRQGMQGMVLADSAGLLVAASIRGDAAEEMAALAPLLARAEGDPMLLDGLTHDSPVQVHRLQVDRTQLFLCVLGDSRRSASGADLATRGVQRILTTH